MGVGGGVAQAQAAARAVDRVAAAHHDLVADPAVQFTMTPVVPPPKPPEWLIHLMQAVGRGFAWIAHFIPDAPYARILLWTVIALLAAVLVWIVVDRVRYGVWRLPQRRRRRGSRSVDSGMDTEPWQPGAAPIREWLAEADALAATGRYAEAVHHLLFRSIEDIGRRRPQAVRPALTSRELAVAGAIPATARDLFARIARLVERSLFGGRPVDADDWQAARTAYADLARPRTWQHG